MRTERSRLETRFTAMAADGLRDVRFDVAPGAPDTETVCAEVNALYDAVARGQSSLLDFGDSIRR